VPIARPVLVLLALTAATSIAAALDPELYIRLSLIPDRVWHGELWRLVTWPFLEGGPIALLMSCAAIYWFGGALVIAWGHARFTGYVAAVLAVASAGTTLLALVVPGATHFPYFAGFALDAALVIAWALTFPDRRLRIYYGTIVLGGRSLAHGLAAMTVLFAVFWGVAPFLPELFACAVALIATSRTWRQWTRRRGLTAHRGGRHGGPYYS
jgi:membrane associated rhomboid family serine protease